MTARRIVFVIFDGLQPIDLVGPHEVFSYVEQVRIESARRALTEGDDPVDAIARRCGFGTETLRRVFQRRLGVAPSEYRDRFRLTPLKETP